MIITTTPEKIFLQNYKIGSKNPFFLIAGPCVIEDEALLHNVVSSIQKICNELNILFIFKASYDKANRSSNKSFRGVGIKEGLKILSNIKKQYNVPIITDVHLPEEIEQVADVVDIIQIPAFLCRQTDLIVEAAKTKKWLNIKKGQFLAPQDVIKIIEKVNNAGSNNVLICERGYTFGYNNLVVDMRGIEWMRKQGIHVVMDATHSTQLPGGGEQSGGEREMAFPLARAAAAVGVEGFFIETHPNPPTAKSDSSNQMYLKDMETTIKTLFKIDRLIKE